MTTTIITSILSILCVIIELAFSERARKEREQRAIDRAFAKKDLDWIAIDLNSYHERVREKNRDITRQQKDNTTPDKQ